MATKQDTPWSLLMLAYTLHLSKRSSSKELSFCPVFRNLSYCGKNTEEYYVGNEKANLRESQTQGNKRSSCHISTSTHQTFMKRKQRKSLQWRKHIIERSDYITKTKFAKLWDRSRKDKMKNVHLLKISLLVQIVGMLLSPKRYRDDSINTTYFNTIDSYSSHERQRYRRSAVS